MWHSFCFTPLCLSRCSNMEAFLVNVLLQTLHSQGAEWPSWQSRRWASKPSADLQIFSQTWHLSWCLWNFFSSSDSILVNLSFNSAYWSTENQTENLVKLYVSYQSPTCMEALSTQLLPLLDHDSAGVQLEDGGEQLPHPGLHLGLGLVSAHAASHGHFTHCKSEAKLQVSYNTIYQSKYLALLFCLTLNIIAFVY